LKVSVCIQTYNHEPFIAQALDSVLMQETGFDYEIILGEDESQDGTREICVEYARQHPDRIRLILRSRKDVIFVNGRPTGRFNLIENLKAAEGEYIALLEGDDYWTNPFKLQKQVDFLESHPECAMCHHKVPAITESGNQVVYVNPPHSYRRISVLEDLLIKNYIQFCSVVFRNGLLKELPEWFNLLNFGDWPLFVLIAQHGKIGYIDYTMAAYRIHSGGIWSAKSDIDRWKALLEASKQIGNYLGPRYERIISASVSRLYFNLAAAYIKEGEVKKAKEYARRSLSDYLINPHIGLLDMAVLLGRLYFPVVHKMLKSIEPKVKSMRKATLSN
jgi:glycosyltransferase involved in cell wall biosynthesis